MRPSVISGKIGIGHVAVKGLFRILDTHEKIAGFFDNGDLMGDAGFE